MSIENDIFKRARIIIESLPAHGFIKTAQVWTYEREFMSNKFRAVITITKSGKITGTVIDTTTGEEFLPMRVENMTDGFIGRVKDEYEQILIDIRNKCCTQNYFIGDQANRIADKIAHRYHTVPMFPWAKYPAFGVFKHNDNKKWFALFMNLDMGKLDKKRSGEIDIMNVKLDPAEIKKLVKKRGFYPAYHMNKVSWITISLDDTLPDNIVMDLIGESFNLTSGN